MENESIELGVANALQSTEDRWLRLAEYGDWPHPLGLQRFTRRSAERLADFFQSLRGRLARRFGGLPVYIGHPDDPGFAGQHGHEDTRAYAWIQQLEARPDGLYIRPRWSPEGERLLANAFYKFLSPRWAMRPLADGIFEPVRLISVGLTNSPNIPGDAIANASAQPGLYPQSETDEALPPLDEILTALGLEAEAALLPACQKLRSDAERWRQEGECLVECNTRLKAARPALKTAFASNGITPGRGERAQPSLIALVNERAASGQLGFAEAWQQLKRERPDLYFPEP